MKAQAITAIVVIAIQIFFAVSWGMNVYRLAKCDFEPSYKGEIIHGIGLFTPISVVTGWVNFDK